MIGVDRTELDSITDAYARDELLHFDKACPSHTFAAYLVFFGSVPSAFRGTVPSF